MGKEIMATDKVMVTTDSGEQVEAVAPVIISASRATDIPAFYAEWFFRRLDRGYCVWVNPFNRKPTYVSFERCKVVVFWTKNPAPMQPYLHRLDERGIHYYFQMTLNDYGEEGFEPCVPPLAERVETFRRLSGMLGPGRVVWRFDPLIVTPRLTPRQLLGRIWRLGNMIEGCTERLVFSFVDVAGYRKVQANLAAESGAFTKETAISAEPGAAQQLELAAGLARLRDAWAERGWRLELATCAESIDLSSYGIMHGRCIDGELMERLFGDDFELVFYLRTGRLPERDMYGNYPVLPAERRDMKDKGQRKVCGCMVSKDIGMYDTCGHFCAYCYANASRERVQKNMAGHRPECESLVGFAARDN